MPKRASPSRTVRASAIVSLVVVVTALNAAAQQVQVDGKNALSDSKNQPAPPSPAPTGYVIPQMIGDEGFGLALDPLKIAENESPRPTDRVFFTYNYFNNIGGSQNNNFNIDVHRAVIGFEKTFFDGTASIGLRLPFSTVDQTLFRQSNTDTNFGDLNLITKFAFYNNPATGNLISGGLSITLPTETGNPDFRDVKFQPYVGAIYFPFVTGQAGNFYIHGFSSVVVPTDSRDDTLLFNDIGFGYIFDKRSSGRFTPGASLALSNWIEAIVPTFEVHINTPIDSPNPNPSTWVNVTPGVHFVFPGQTIFTLGGTVPVTGPKPFDFEIETQLNIHF